MRSRRIAAGWSAALLLAACGGGGQGGAETDRTPVQVLQDAAAALKAAASFHLAVVVDGGAPGGGRLDIDADVVAPSTVQGTIKEGNATGRFVFAGGKVYLQGREFLTLLAGDAIAKQIGDQWVIAPAAAAGSGVGQIADMRKFADCMVQNHGTLTKGNGTVDGQDAVILTDKADRPGTQPGRLYVAARGTAYPLKLEITGPTTAGPPANAACTSNGSSTGSLTFSEYGKAFSIAAPTSALDLSGGR